MTENIVGEFVVREKYYSLIEKIRLITQTNMTYSKKLLFFFNEPARDGAHSYR